MLLTLQKHIELLEVFDLSSKNKYIEEIFESHESIYIYIYDKGIILR